MTVAKVTAVLIPVVVGSFLGLIVSLSTHYFTFRAEQAATLKKEHDAHLERAMTLVAKYQNDLAKLLGIGFLTKGNITPNDLATATAPTDTLLELRVVISLYFPKLKSEVEQIGVAHRTMIDRLDDIIGAHGEHPGEDTAAFRQRIQKEMAPTLEHVQSLMKKLSEEPH